jgi:hypothetical protein
MWTALSIPMQITPGTALVMRGREKVRKAVVRFRTRLPVPAR